MAERRMFAKSVIGSARFLRMPSTSRLLYYDLGMQADDDGIVEAFSVMRTTGATEDDLRVLASKGFVTVLNDDLVTYIADWRRNNLIKNDRYHPSVYHEMLVQLNDGTQVEPTWNPIGTQMEPEVRLSKDIDILCANQEAFDAFWKAYPKKKNKVDAKKAFAKVNVPLQTLLDAIERQKQSAQWTKDGGQFIPYPATWLNRGAWEDEADGQEEISPPKPRIGRLIIDENGEEVVRFD